MTGAGLGSGAVGLSGEIAGEVSCDREEIRFIQSIQGQGCLIAFTATDQRVQCISRNFPQAAKKSVREVLGMKLDHLFESDFVKAIDEAVRDFPWESPGRHVSSDAAIGGKAHDAYLFESEGLFVLEFEERSSEAILPIEGERIVKEFALAAKSAKTIEDLSLLVCKAFRRVTGFDRAMMYRFLPPHWHGETIAEDRIASAHSYLAHRFPASDIPRPARDLYLRNQVRLISDVDAEVSPIEPSVNPRTKKPLDLADSRLRAVAPIHLEYLRNMGVKASFSVSVSHEGELWGLIACHGLTPIRIPQSKRTICETIAHIFSIQAPLLEATIENKRRLDFDAKLRKILESVRKDARPLDGFFKRHKTVCDAFGATGIALVGSKLSDLAGLTPLKSHVEALGKELREKIKASASETGRWAVSFDRLSAENHQWSEFKDQACGALATMLPDEDESVLMLFRPETVQTILWGGDPRKQLHKRDFQGQINPRKSFEAWEETISGQSTPWLKFETEGLLFIREFVFKDFAPKELGPFGASSLKL